MNRRALLAGASIPLTSSLAGCVENLGSNIGGFGDGDGLATISLASIRTYSSADELPAPYSDSNELVLSPSDFDLDIDIEIGTKTATPEIPASFEITMRYEGTEPFTYQIGGASYMLSNSGLPELGLQLYPEDREIDREDDDCWRATRRGNFPESTNVTLRPRQRNKRKYNIVAIADADTCYPTGEYELVQYFRVPDRNQTVIYWAIVLELS